MTPPHLSPTKAFDRTLAGLAVACLCFSGWQLHSAAQTPNLSLDAPMPSEALRGLAGLAWGGLALLIRRNTRRAHKETEHSTREQAELRHNHRKHRVAMADILANLATLDPRLRKLHKDVVMGGDVRPSADGPSPLEQFELDQLAYRLSVRDGRLRHTGEVVTRVEPAGTQRTPKDNPHFH